MLDHRRRVATCVATCALFLTVLVGRVEAKPGAVLVFGTAGPREQDTVSKAIAGSLRSASWTLITEPIAKDTVTTIVACFANERPWPCIAPIVEKIGIEQLVIARVTTGKGDHIEIAARLVVAGNAVPALAERSCDACSEARLFTLTSDLTQSLVDESPTPSAGTAILAATTVPPASPSTREGHPVIGRQVDKITTRGVSRIVPLSIGTAGLGGAVVGLGISWMKDPPPPGVAHTHQSHVYSPTGLAVGCVGVVAIGVAAYLWLGHPPRTTAGPMVAIGDGGGTAGWTISF